MTDISHAYTEPESTIPTPGPRRPLTARQREILDIIARFAHERGYPPTLREIGEATGIRSTNGVNDHLRALERKGRIRRDDLKSRGIVVVALGEEAGVLPVGSMWAPRKGQGRKADLLKILRPLGDEHVETVSSTGRRSVARVSHIVLRYQCTDGAAAPLPNALRKLAPKVEAPAVAPAPVDPIAPMPEDMGVRVYVFRGRPCVIAAAVGKALGYADNGKALPEVITKQWAGEMLNLANYPTPGAADFAVLKGADLRDFKKLPDVTEDASVSPKTPNLMVLFETGFDLVLQKTDKPEGQRLRRRLAEEVLPKLRRGEPVTRPTAAPPALDVRAIVAETVRELVPAIIRETLAALPQAAPALPAGPVAPVVDMVPKGWMGAREIALYVSGALGFTVSEDRVNKSIRECKIRGRGADIARQVQSVHVDGNGRRHENPKWVYSPAIVSEIETEIRTGKTGSLFQRQP